MPDVISRKRGEKEDGGLLEIVGERSSSKKCLFRVFYGETNEEDEETQQGNNTLFISAH